MRKVRLDDLDSRMGPADRSLPLTDALGVADAALNFYELAPGDSFAYGFHAHENQEEIFYVLSGTATFEVGTEREEVTVDGGEVIRFPPGEFQSGHNHSDEPVRALVVGAPGARHEWDALESMAPCADCGEETSHAVRPPNDEGVMQLVCNECGAEMF